MPTPEEVAAEKAQRQNENVEFIDTTLGAMRQAILNEDWEAQTLAHSAQYEKWKEGQMQKGLPIPPPGKWYVTEVLMHQLGEMLSTGGIQPASRQTRRHTGASKKPEPTHHPVSSAAGEAAKRQKAEAVALHGMASNHAQWECAGDNNCEL